MITKVFINSIINLVFDSLIIFFIFYSIIYAILRNKIKTKYLDIDNWRYIIPVDNKNKEISTLAEELYYNQEEYTYTITIYKNTMIVKSIKRQQLHN